MASIVGLRSLHQADLLTAITGKFHGRARAVLNAMTLLGRRQASRGCHNQGMRLASRSVVVTGGSGFIGTHLVEGLARSGATVTNLDIKAPKLEEHSAYWAECDILDAKQLADKVSALDPDVIYNLAAVTDVLADHLAMRVNTAGLANLVAWAGGRSRPPLLVHFSSMLVVRPGYDSSGPLDFAPYTEYGATKVKSERLLHAADPHLSWVIVRPTNVWGPWHPTYADQIWRYLSKGYYLHPTSRDPRRSYGYVGNVVHQVIRLAELGREEVVGKTLYVGDEVISSSIWLDKFSQALRGRRTRRMPGPMLRILAEAGELSGKIGIPSPIDRGRHYRMTTDYVAPMQPTFELTGRGPVSLDEGVEATVAWLREHVQSAP